MYPSFVIGRSVAGTWNYLTPAPVRRSEANEVQDAAKKAGGVHDGVAYVEIAVYDVPRPTQVERFPPPRVGAPQTSAVPSGAAVSAPSEKAATGMPSADTSRSSDTKPGSGELSQAAKPGLDGALTQPPEIRDAYAARVGAMDRPKLVLEAHVLNLAVRVGTTNEALRKLLVEAKFPPTGGQEGGSGGEQETGI